MASTRPSGGRGGTPNATIGFDYSQLRNAPNVARGYAQATAREISNAFKSLQAEQKLALTQANTTLAAVKAQQSQITATTRAESQVRIQQARAESVAQQQAARTASQVAIQEERRKTAAFNAELRQRRAMGGSLGQGAATFAGAAFGGPIGGLAGAVAGGSPALAAGLVVSGGARFAVEASQSATAYNRQRVAAVNLAGSQAKLNELMETFRRASGGALDKAEGLASVTKLMAVGFADNAGELDKFARAIRGISIAMGTTEDTVTQNLILELFTQRGARLDQLGLQYDKVRARADELRAADTSLTQQQAYQNAVLEQAQERYGALTDSLEGQKTGVEKLAIAWKNLRLEIGQEIKPGVDNLGEWTADFLEWIRQRRAEIPSEAANLLAAAGISSAPLGQRSRDAGRHPAPSFSGAAGSGFDKDQTAALRRREEGFATIERESTLARLEATRSYERQRTSVIAQYEKSIAREAEDFGRQRANAARKLEFAILDIHQDSARQHVKWEQELARNIAEAQADSAERVAEVREDSAERLADSEEKYAKDREKRARDHHKTLREAAANLDAVAVREEQRRFRDEAKEAKNAHEEAKDDIQEQLDERLDDEAKSLAKSERQAREANARRVEEQAENDRLRIEEMRAAFEAQKIEEDAERAIMLGRRAEDHAAQLIEMATAQGERIQQIKDHAQAEREQFTEESNKFLEEVGIHNQAWLDEQEKINEGVIKRHQELLDAQRRALLTPGHPSLADPYIDRNLPIPLVPAANNSRTSNSRSTSITNNIQFITPPNFGANEQSREWVYGVLGDFFEGQLPQ